MRPVPERPGPGQESVWDYPRPPRLEPFAGSITVELGGQTVAATDTAWRVLETSHPPTYYLPPDEVRRDLLVPADGSSFCEWKGVARYWSLVLDGERVERCAWSYPDPTPAHAALRDHLAFYAGLVDECLVDDVRASGQPFLAVCRGHQTLAERLGIELPEDRDGRARAAVVGVHEHALDLGLGGIPLAQPAAADRAVALVRDVEHRDVLGRRRGTRLGVGRAVALLDLGALLRAQLDRVGVVERDLLDDHAVSRSMSSR